MRLLLAAISSRGRGVDRRRAKASRGRGIPARAQRRHHERRRGWVRRAERVCLEHVSAPSRWPWRMRLHHRHRRPVAQRYRKALAGAVERWKRGDQPCAGHPFSISDAPQSGRAGHAKAAGRRPERTGAAAPVAAAAIKHSAGRAACYIRAGRGVARRDAALSEWEAAGIGAASGGESSYGVGQICPSVNGS